MTALSQSPATLPATLLEAVWPTSGRLGVSRLLRGLLVALIGSLLLTLSAKTHVPFYPVPMTMQTFAVLFLAAALGLRLGLAAYALYLMEGALGLPVFSGTPERGVGLAYMVGPTGGYLAGMFVASAVTGWTVDRFGAQALVATATAMMLGLAAIYALGMAWLIQWIPTADIVAKGMAPFILADLLKVGLALAAAVLGYRFARSRKSLS